MLTGFPDLRIARHLFLPLPYTSEIRHCARPEQWESGSIHQVKLYLDTNSASKRVCHPLRSVEKTVHRARLDDVCSLLRKQCRRQKPKEPDTRRQAISNTRKSTEGAFLSLLKHL